MRSYKNFEELTQSGKRKRIMSEAAHYGNNTVLNNIESLSTQNEIVPTQNVNLLTEYVNIEYTIESESMAMEFEQIPVVSNTFDIKNALLKWLIQFNVNKNTVAALLHILKNDRYPELISDSRTLLKTPRSNSIVDLSPGKFTYLGIENPLISICRSLSYEIPEFLFLDINIDGAPIFDNSYANNVIWPILCRVKNLKSDVFPIALYGGNKKPDDFNMLMRPFVEEFNKLKDTFYYNERKIQLRINNFILDAPAKSSICFIAGHTGI